MGYVIRKTLNCPFTIPEDMSILLLCVMCSAELIHFSKSAESLRYLLQFGDPEVNRNRVCCCEFCIP